MPYLPQGTEQRRNPLEDHTVGRPKNVVLPFTTETKKSTPYYFQVAVFFFPATSRSIQLALISTPDMALSRMILTNMCTPLYYT